MSTTPAEAGGDFVRRAGIFAALGDETRLSLIGKLSRGRAQSISRLAEGSSLTRQAVTKHLQVLEAAGLVRSVRPGAKNNSSYARSRFESCNRTSTAFRGNGTKR